jgi:ferritin-like metal-binding protein YciE
MGQIDFSAERPDAEDLLLDIIRECYWCELEMNDILSDIRNLTTQSDLLQQIEIYRAHIELQTQQLKGIFDEWDGNKDNKLKCLTFEVIIREGIRNVKKAPEGYLLREMNIVIMMQQMTLFKVSSYTISASFFRILNKDRVADILEQILLEEKERYAELNFTAAARIFNK